MLTACWVVQEDEDMLKTFQDLFPDELLNPELSSLDPFCLDSTLLPPAAQHSQAAASTFTKGNTQDPKFALQSSSHR